MTKPHQLALSLTLLLITSAVLGQEVAKKVTPSRTACEPGTCISKVLSVPNISAPHELQNVVNIIRVMADITQIDHNQSEHTISLEGTADQIAVAEKLLSVSESLRSSGADKPSSVLVYELNSTRQEPAKSESLIKVLYLPNFATTVEFQDSVNIFRTTADIRRIVPDPSSHAIWLRGTAEQIAIVERLASVMENLQSSRGQKRSSVFVYELKGSMPEPAVSEKFSEETIAHMRSTICDLTTCVIKAFYLPDLSTAQLSDVINRVRTTAQITRICPSPSRHLLVVRGTPEQVGLAEKLANE